MCLGLNMTYCGSRYINSINRQHKSYTLAINHLADRIDHELSALMRSTVDHDFGKGNKTGDVNGDDDYDNEVKGSYGNLDTELDWRKFGAITEIKGKFWEWRMICKWYLRVYYGYY